MRLKNKLFWIILSLALILRVVKLSSFPPGLYSDEAAYGYNAFSLLTTGRDEYGKFWPLALENFGDYKPPMTAWLTIPFIAVFGLNEFAVRLPSALAGTITVAIIYFLARELFPNKSLKIAQISSLLLAISPWHLHFSRSGMLVSIEAMFISLGFLMFIQGLKRPARFYIAAVSFVAAIYTYYGARVTVPLLVIVLSLIFLRRLLVHTRQVILAGLLGLLLLTPLLLAIAKNPNTLTGRAKTVSVFFDPGIKAKLWQAYFYDNQQLPTTISRFFHNKPYYYFRDITRRYLQHFSYDFQVLSGDSNRPFKLPHTGYVYLISFFFSLFGFWRTLRLNQPKSHALLAYLFLSPFVASLTFLTPSANRSFNLIIPLTLITAYGIFLALKNRLLLIVIASLYLFSFINYLNVYYVKLPQQLADQWHYGRKQLVQAINNLSEDYDRLVLSPSQGPAYIWLLFYNQYPPQQYWQQADVDHSPDYLGWIHVNSFANFYFPRQFDWQTIDKSLNTLYVGNQDQLPDSWSGKQGNSTLSLVIDRQINFPNGRPAFKIAHLVAN